MNEKIIDFNKKDFKELPTGWFFDKEIEKKGIFLGFKIGELKNGEIYIGFLCGRTDGISTQKDFDVCIERIRIIAENSSKEFKQLVCLVYPIEDWLLEGLSKEWIKDYIEGRKTAMEQSLSYIG